MKLKSLMLCMLLLCAVRSALALTPPSSPTLHEAVTHDAIDAVERLLEGGASVTAVDRDYRTPLHLAARQGNLELMTLLLDRGADVNARDRKGNTPLHAAFYNRPASVALLLDRGANVNAQNHIGNALLHNSVFYLSVVETLLAHGADIHRENHQGMTPLAIAGIAGRETVVARLAGAGGDTNDALFNAVYQGQVETVRVLLEQGGNIHVRNADGHTLLHKALMAQVASAEVVDVLLNAGADVHAVADRAPMAHGSSHTLLAQQPLHLAVRGRQRPYPYLEISARLIAAGAAVNAEDGHGLTPFIYAIRRGAHYRRLYAEYPALIHLLLERGADLNRGYPDGRTPLHYAAGLVSPHYSIGTRANDAIIEILIAAGLAVDARDDQGRTPLHEAARVRNRGHHWERRKLNAAALLEHGAHVNTRDHHGQTPLHLAALAGSVRNVLLLLEHGAATDIEDHDGHTARELALKQQHTSVAGLLEAP